MIQCKTTGFTRDEIRQAIRIQIQELPQGFLSSLGEKPLELIFAHVASSRWGVFVIAVDAEKEEVIGYVFGSLDTSRLYKEFLLKKTIVALVNFLPRMLSFERLWKAFETLLYPTKSETIPLPKPELLDLAVLRAYHGKGVAQVLFNTFVDEYRVRGVTAFRIPTSDSLTRAHGFYEKMGAERAGAVDIHRGQQTFLYVYRIENAR